MGVAPSAVRHLYEIHAVLCLPPYFCDHIGHVVGQHAVKVLRRAHPGGFVVGDAAVGDDESSGAVDAGTLQHSGVDRFPQSHVDEPGATGNGYAGHPRPQDCLGVPGRLQSGELGAGRPPANAYAGHGRLAEGQMAVSIDEPWHDPPASSVDDPHAFFVFQVQARRNPADAGYAVSLDNHGLIFHGRTAGAINQGAVADDGGLLVLAGHGSLRA